MNKRNLFAVPYIQILRCLFASVLPLPILAIGHELATVGAAVVLRWLMNSRILATLIGVLPIDTADVTIVAKSLGGIKPVGIAVAGFPGQVLHDLIPRLFTEPGNVSPGALVSAVIGDVSSLSSWLVTVALTEIALIIAGGMLIRSGWRRLRLDSSSHLQAAGWIGLGLLIQAESILAVARLQLSRQVLENMGLGLFLGTQLRMDRLQYQWFMEQALPAIIPATILVLGFLGAWSLGQLLDGLGVLRANLDTTDRWRRVLLSFPNRLRLVGLLMLLVGFFQFLPGYAGIAQTNNDARADSSFLQVPLYIPADDPSWDILAEPQVLTPEPTASPQATSVSPVPSPTATVARTPQRSTPQPKRTTLALRETLAVLPPAARPPYTLPPSLTSTAISTPMLRPPALVEIRKASNGLALYVNGHPRIIRAINYNVNYTAKPEADQLMLHRRDFQILRQNGFNAITGLGTYNENTLKAAEEYHLGVVMPYLVDLNGDYQNAAYRAQVKTGFLKFVARFRDFPAVWGWNPGGDEWLHNREKVVKGRDARQAGADFLIELADAGHQADPNHLVFTKEPRDWYLPLLEQALNKLRARGQEPNTYFVYGGNFYGNPEEIGPAMVSLKTTVDQKLGVALCITEYGPYGLERDGRSKYYVQIWRKLTPLSIGGSAYVYTGPNNPNPANRDAVLETEFRMVNYDGLPVDDTLAALAAQFKAERDALQAIQKPKP